MDETWEAVLPPLLQRAGIFGDARIAAIRPLTGGVSSDIVHIALTNGQQLCAKRALPRLKVASVWEAPLERNHYEAAWLRRAGLIRPGAVPAVIGEDEARGIVVLDYLPPEDFLLWKDELLAGRFDAKVPSAVADTLGAIHAATWGSAEIAAEFPTDSLFDALRLDPYLRTLAARTPDLSAKILQVVEATATSKQALVHGDVSPKNILIHRRDGHPVLLDAECAWYGDPAFDCAFCTNHLLLKAVKLPALAHRLLPAAGAFFATWIAHVPRTERPAVEARVAALLPCLFLARVDGKSPVEYLDAGEQDTVRRLSRPLIAEPAGRFAEVLARIGEGLGR